MHTKNLENSSKIENFMGQNAQAHKLNLMSVYIYTYTYTTCQVYMQVNYSLINEKLKFTKPSPD